MNEEDRETGGSITAATGGLINELISNLYGSKEENQDQDLEENRKEFAAAADAKKSEDGGSRDRGIIKQIMSHLHGREDGSSSEDAVRESNGGGTGTGTSGGIPSQIVTNLPTVSIPGDSSPKAEEASLLIHIVQD